MEREYAERTIAAALVAVTAGVCAVGVLYQLQRRQRPSLGHYTQALAGDTCLDWFSSLLPNGETDVMPLDEVPVDGVPGPRLSPTEEGLVRHCCYACDTSWNDKDGDKCWNCDEPGGQGVIGGIVTSEPLHGC